MPFFPLRQWFQSHLQTVCGQRQHAVARQGVTQDDNQQDICSGYRKKSTYNLTLCAPSFTPPAWYFFFFCIICQFSSSQRKKVQKKISTRQFCSNPKSERDCKDLVKGRERLWKNLKNQSVKFLATYYSSTSHNVDTLTCHLTTFPNVSCISTECLTLVVIKWPWIGLTFFLCKKNKINN